MVTPRNINNSSLIILLSSIERQTSHGRYISMNDIHSPENMQCLISSHPWIWFYRGFRCPWFQYSYYSFMYLLKLTQQCHIMRVNNNPWLKCVSNHASWRLKPPLPSRKLQYYVMTREWVHLKLLRCIASMCRQLTKCTRNVRTPAMKFAWRPALFHVKSVSVHPNSGVGSGVRSFFVRTQVLYMRPLNIKELLELVQAISRRIQHLCWSCAGAVPGSETHR